MDEDKEKLTEEETEENVVEVENKKSTGSKAALITVVIFILFILLIVFLVRSRFANVTSDSNRAPTPTIEVFDQTTDEEAVMEEDANLTSPVPTELIEETGTVTPTKNLTPTPPGPSGFQNIPTNSPTPTSLPLSN